MGADADSIVDEFGLGLRKKRVMSKAAPGSVFILINASEQTIIAKGKASLSSTDKSLSAEARLRKSPLQFDVAPLDHLIAEAKLHRSSFYVSSRSDANIEDCKKKIVTMVVDETPVSERFSRCLITEVENCHFATERVAAACGLGLRRGNVNSRKRPGCVLMLLPSTGHPPLPIPKTADACSGASAGKRKNPEGEAAAASTATAKPPGSAPKVRKQVHQTNAGPADVHVSDEAEALYCKQVDVIEKKLAMLLPTLSPQEISSTEVVQAKLEQALQKPTGRLQKFTKEIGRVRRAFLERSSSSRQR